MERCRWSQSVIWLLWNFEQTGKKAKKVVWYLYTCALVDKNESNHPNEIQETSSHE
jgi:hypothetical protein